MSASVATGKFTRTNAMQTYISLMAYTFDILSFVAVTFVAVPFGNAIYPGALKSSLLIVWGGFAAGSVLRPVGAAIVGPLYDKVGRKRGLYIGVFGSAGFTAILAALPTYASVGILSPILYIVFRLIGGIFIGALIAGGLVFTTENLPERLRGFITGTAEAGGSWAHVVGAAWLILVTAMFVGAAYDTTGWRVFFLVALLPLVVVLPVLYFVPESAILTRAKKKGKVPEATYKTLFSKTGGMRTPFLIAVFSSIGLLGFDNLTENQFPTFLRVLNHVPSSHIATLVLVGAAFGVIGSMAGGAISQRVGRKPFAIGMGVVLVIISFLFFHLGNQPADAYYAILLTLIPFYFFASLAKANLALYLNESFATGVRSTAVGLNWNLGYGIAGLWPLVIAALYDVYGLHTYTQWEAYFCLGMAVIYLIASIISKETVGNISKEEQLLVVEDSG